MIWIIILIIALVVIVLLVKKGQEKKEANKLYLQECAKKLNEQWAICVTRFIYSEKLEPCLIHIVEKNGKKEVLRVVRNSSQEEPLFKVSEEGIPDSYRYRWSGDNDRGVYCVCDIDIASSSEKEEHANVECGLTLNYNHEVLCYIVLAFVDDVNDAADIINEKA